MARRVFLHIGTPKTGTTFLQSVLWANKDALRAQGVLLPLGSVHEHFHLSTLVRNAPAARANMPPRALGAWDRMLHEVGGWDDDVLISHELFAPSSRNRVVWATEQLADLADEVHIIVTARDLARQVPAEWQQMIKHGRDHRIDDFYERLKVEDPTDWFWLVQDVPTVLARWSTGIRSDRIHVVTVPPAGVPRGLLWSRFAGVIGVDPESVDRSVTSPNESLGLTEIELVRRSNEHLPSDVAGPRQQMVIRQIFAEGVLAQRPDLQKFAPPAEQHPWVVKRGTLMVQQLREAPYDVVGDLDELLPPEKPADGPRPDSASDSDIARVAVEALPQALFDSFEKGFQMGSRKGAGPVRNQLQTKDKRIAELEKQLRNARKAFREERGQPMRVHLRRRAGLIKRKLLRRPRP